VGAMLGQCFGRDVRKRLSRWKLRRERPALLQFATHCLMRFSNVFARPMLPQFNRPQAKRRPRQSAESRRSKHNPQARKTHSVKHFRESAACPQSFRCRPDRRVWSGFPEARFRLFVYGFSTSFCRKTFGVASALSTIQIEVWLNTLSLQARDNSTESLA
jgi:hypothetical protein